MRMSGEQSSPSPSPMACASVESIPRVSSSQLSAQDFQRLHFSLAKPVVITGAADHWPARQWTIPNLVDRVGANEVWVRGDTDRDEYRQGNRYIIRKDTLAGYCSDLVKGNARARSSYLAVNSLQQAFPQLLPDVPMPEYLTANGKLHLGPYLWMALEGHYEFCHFDPDDNFLVIIQGRKRVRLFGYDLENMYPNELGSLGKTVQSQVDCDKPDLARHPKFASARCQETVLCPGEMLFIPAFMWHQVTALDTGISLNMFYGDAGDSAYLDKVLGPPYKDHCLYWLRNILEQNRRHLTFAKMAPRMREVLSNFFLKQWHEVATERQLDAVMDVVDTWLDREQRCQGVGEADKSKFPPMLKIRGLLHRDNAKLKASKDLGDGRRDTDLVHREKD